MTENEKLLSSIKKYQNCIYVHPLTCGTDSNHSLLEGRILNGNVVLVCPDCDYIQEWVPDIVNYVDDYYDGVIMEVLKW